MKRKTFAALLPLALVLTAAWAAPGSAPPGQPPPNRAAVPAAVEAGPNAPRPVLTVENANLDLGKIQEGTDAVGTFKLKNTGNVELKILSAKPG